MVHSSAAVERHLRALKLEPVILSEVLSAEPAPDLPELRQGKRFEHFNPATEPTGGQARVYYEGLSTCQVSSSGKL